MKVQQRELDLPSLLDPAILCGIALVLSAMCAVYVRNEAANLVAAFALLISHIFGQRIMYRRVRKSIWLGGPKRYVVIGVAITVVTAVCAVWFAPLGRSERPNVFYLVFVELLIFLPLVVTWWAAGIGYLLRGRA